MDSHSPEERLIARIFRRSSGCWEVSGRIWDSNPYPRMSPGRGQNPQSTHLVAWKMWVGPVPEGCELHHLCGNTRCCNPEHLLPVSRKQHVHLGQTFANANAGKTHCPQGHPYSAANTEWSPLGQRSCRICKRERVRAFQKRYKVRRLAAVLLRVAALKVGVGLVARVYEREELGADEGGADGRRQRAGMSGQGASFLSPEKEGDARHSADQRRSRVNLGAGLSRTHETALPASQVGR